MNIQRQTTLVLLVGIFGLVIICSIVSYTYAAEPYVFVRKWGSAGVDNGQFDKPENVGLSSNNVYVADSYNHRIQKFDTHGNFITTWGSVCWLSTNDNRCRDPDGSGSLDLGDGQFNRPQDVVVDSTGKVYVVDSFNDRIQKFDSNGNFITKWGSQGSGESQFSTPFGIAIDSSDNVYVDDHNDRVQKFTSNGDFITEWGSQGFGDGQFQNPHGIAIDSSDNVYVADEATNRIQKFDSDGNFMTKWGSTPGHGTADGELGSPFGIDIDSSDNVYVANTGFDRIEKFSKDGTFITNWGSSGSWDGELKRAKGIAVDSSGKVYVSDTGNYRIQVFSQLAHNIPLAISLDRAAACTDITAEMKGISVRFTITGLYHLDTTYKFEVRGPSGHVVIDESNGVPVTYDLTIPADASNPATTFLGLSFGTHEVGKFTFIVSGSDGSEATKEFAVPSCSTDILTPDTTVTSSIDGNNKNIGDGGFSSSNSIKFSFVGTDNEGIQGFKCKLDQNNLENCTVPKTFVNLQDGEHAFSVLAIDTSSNEDPTPATFDWTIDTIKPILTAPSSDLIVQATSSSGAVVTFTATAHNDIDGNFAANCIPASGSTFPVGNTNVKCSATDKAGNTATNSFNVLVKEPPKPVTEHSSLSLAIKPNRPIGIGQDYSLYGRLFDGTTGRKLLGGQDISFTSEPSGIISVPLVKIDAFGKFMLTGLKAPDKDGSYKIVAHFSGNTFLQPSDSIPVQLEVEKKTTSLKLENKGSPISGASLNGDLTDLTTRKGISSQIISFTTNKPDLVVHATTTESNGRYNVLLDPLECGTTNIQIQSHFLGTDAFKPSDSKVSILKIPRCSSSHLPSSSLEIHTVTNSSRK